MKQYKATANLGILLELEFEMPDGTDDTDAEAKATELVEAWFGETKGDVSLGSSIYVEVEEQPSAGKLALIAYLTGHTAHGDAHQPAHLAWDIKVRFSDNTGWGALKRHPGGLALSHQWDERWEEYLQAHSEAIWERACEDGLTFVGDGKWRHYNWTDGLEGCDGVDYTLWQAGRSGGWLELFTFDGSTVGWSDRADDWLDYDEAWLAKLVVFCKSLDAWDATEEYEWQVACIREQMEDEWDKEKEAA